MRKPQDPNILNFAPSKEETPAGNSYQRGIDALQSELSGLRSEEPTLNGLELTSVRALVAYVAYTNGLNESVISSIVENYFGADDIQKIHQADYDRVVAYLVDLDPRMIVN